ncbi:hypothetical protein [Thermincola potens]|uniref:hypothetical protein n=1 Tax=Thermincola potens TaxID=863643 RepID=UPI0018E060E2|nr:hypothetical protein [Thermincola potens]
MKVQFLQIVLAILYNTTFIRQPQKLKTGRILNSVKEVYLAKPLILNKAYGQTMPKIHYRSKGR